MTGYRGNLENLSQMTRRWLASPPPGPAHPPPWHGIQCPAQGCFTICCGPSEQEAEGRLAEHRRRCHS